MNTKTCKTCSTDKDLSEFSKHASCKYGVRPECKSCRNNRQSVYIKQGDNHSRYISYKRNHYQDNKPEYALKHSENPNKKTNAHRDYIKHKPDYLHRAKLSKLRVHTPPWANLDAIKQFYIDCPDGFHVDHITPLNGKLVSGLHVEGNLQIISADENLKKGSSFNVMGDTSCT